MVHSPLSLGVLAFTFAAAAWSCSSASQTGGTTTGTGGGHSTSSSSSSGAGGGTACASWPAAGLMTPTLPSAALTARRTVFGMKASGDGLVVAYRAQSATAPFACAGATVAAEDWLLVKLDHSGGCSWLQNFGPLQSFDFGTLADERLIAVGETASGQSGRIWILDGAGSMSANLTVPTGGAAALGGFGSVATVGSVAFIGGGVQGSVAFSGGDQPLGNGTVCHTAITTTTPGQPDGLLVRLDLTPGSADCRYVRIDANGPMAAAVSGVGLDAAGDPYVLQDIGAPQQPPAHDVVLRHVDPMLAGVFGPVKLTSLAQAHGYDPQFHVIDGSMPLLAVGSSLAGSPSDPELGVYTLGGGVVSAAPGPVEVHGAVALSSSDWLAFGRSQGASGEDHGFVKRAQASAVALKEVSSLSAAVPCDADSALVAVETLQTFGGFAADGFAHVIVYRGQPGQPGAGALTPGEPTPYRGRAR